MLTTIKSKMATTMLFYLIFLKLKQRKEITSENNLQNRVKTIISKMEIDITQSDENKSNVIATKLFDSDTETVEMKKKKLIPLKRTLGTKKENEWLKKILKEQTHLRF